MPRISSKGTCKLCGKQYGKSAMSRHVASCVGKQAPADAPARTLYHLRVEARYDPRYWLDVEMAGDAPMALLDSFLRRIWLECCGHLSEFSIPQPRRIHLPPQAYIDVIAGRKKLSAEDEAAIRQWQDLVARPPGEVDMESTADQTFKNLQKPLKYEYDFGSTTELVVKCVGTREGRAPDLRLLARNDPPAWECVECGKPAQWLCPYCYEDNLFCETHGRKHKCPSGGEGEESMMSVVNSPRMGVCGYGGPAEDVYL